MKNLSKLYSMSVCVAFVLMLTACSKSMGDPLEQPLYNFTINASMENIGEEGTKMEYHESLNSVSTLAFTTDEQISLFIRKNNATVAHNVIMTPTSSYSLPGKSAQLTGQIPLGIGGEDFISVFLVSPYHQDNTMDAAGVVTAVLPDTFSMGAGILRGVTTFGSFSGRKREVAASMTTQYALLKIPITMEAAAGTDKRNLSQIKVRGNDNEVIAGPATLRWAEIEFLKTDPAAKKEIVVNIENTGFWISNARSRNVYVAIPRLVPPVWLHTDPTTHVNYYGYYATYERGLTFDFVFSDGTVSTVSSKPMTDNNKTPQSTRLTVTNLLTLPTPTAP